MRKIEIHASDKKLTATAIAIELGARACDRIYPENGQWFLWTKEAGGKHTWGREAQIVVIEQ